MAPRLLARVAFALAFAMWAAGCGSYKDSSAPDAAAGLDGSTGGSEGGTATGPGPLGALPGGYCCTADAECRTRSCVDLGGGNRMCMEECDGAQSICEGIVMGFTCVWNEAGVVGTCQPPATSTACVPASQYVHGTQPTGACCTATGNATAGRECAGGLCDSFGSTSNPFICTQACTTQAECPTGYTCSNVGNYSFCARDADPYTCP